MRIKYIVLACSLIVLMFVSSGSRASSADSPVSVGPTADSTPMAILDRDQCKSDEDFMTRIYLAQFRMFLDTFIGIPTHIVMWFNSTKYAFDKEKKPIMNAAKIAASEIKKKIADSIKESNQDPGGGDNDNKK